MYMCQSWFTRHYTLIAQPSPLDPYGALQLGYSAVCLHPAAVVMSLPLCRAPLAAALDADITHTSE